MSPFTNTEHWNYAQRHSKGISRYIKFARLGLCIECRFDVIVSRRDPLHSNILQSPCWHNWNDQRLHSWICIPKFRPDGRPQLLRPVAVLRVEKTEDVLSVDIAAVKQTPVSLRNPAYLDHIDLGFMVRNVMAWHE